MLPILPICPVFMENTQTFLFDRKYICWAVKHAAMEEKILRINHALYMTKIWRKVTMWRSLLELRQKKTLIYIIIQEAVIFCGKLHRKERRCYYKTLDIPKQADNRQFWEKMKSLLCEKIPQPDK